MHRAIAVVLASWLAACAHIGPTTDAFAPAQDAAGAWAYVRAGGRTFDAELLEVRDGGLLVLRDERVAFVPWAAIDLVRLRDVRLTLHAGAPPPDARERVRLLSRFPHPLSAELLARLLARYGQTEPDVIAAAGADHHHHAATYDTTAPDVAAFLAAARAATRAFADPDVAAAHGYRRVGPEFPGMGTHWVHTGLLLDATLDAAAPAVLTYADVAGRAVLTGAAYILPLGAGVAAPSFPHPAAWHDHTGTLDEEVLLIGGAGGGVRAAMLHAWLWAPNPDGVFAQENWALPYLRLGYAAPAAADERASRALSLVRGGDAYWAAVLAAAAPGAANARAYARTLARARDAAARLTAAGRPDADALALVWTRMWADVHDAVDAATWARLAPLAARTGGDE